MFFKNSLKEAPRETELFNTLEQLTNIPQNINLAELVETIQNSIGRSGHGFEDHNYHFISPSLFNSEFKKNDHILLVLTSPVFYTTSIFQKFYKYTEKSYKGTNKRDLPFDYDTKERRIKQLKKVVKIIKRSLLFFSSEWEFKLSLQPKAFVTEYTRLLELSKYSKDDRIKIIDRVYNKAVKPVEKAEKHINRILHNIMTNEIPRWGKLLEVTEAIIRLETVKFDELESRFEQKLDQALKQQLEEVEIKHKKQLIEVHENIGRLQDMIDKTYQQNELLLEAQKEKGKEYENQLFGLLEKLKNES